MGKQAGETAGPGGSLPGLGRWPALISPGRASRLFGVAAQALALLLLIAIAARLVLDNQELFRGDFILTGDFAATSIGTFDAEHLKQLYGTPSFNGYYHPGPVLMYYRALFDGPARVLGLGSVSAALMASHVVLIVLLLGLVLFSLKRTWRGTRDDLAFSVFAVWALFVVERPAFLRSFWEPQVGGLLYLCSVLAGAAALGTRRTSWIAVTVIAGGLAVQLQLTFSLPVAALYLAVALFYFEDSRRMAKELPWILGAAVVAYLPVILDLGLHGGANLGRVRAYAEVSRGRPSLPTAEAWRIVERNLGWSSPVFAAVLLIIAVTALTGFLEYGNRRSLSAWIGRMTPVAPLCGLALVALAGALVFHLFLSDRTYSPPHASAYAYLMGAVVCGSLVAFLTSTLPRAIATAPAIVLLVTAILVVSFGDGLGEGGSPYSGFASPALTELRDAAKTAKAADARYVSQIAIEGRTPNEWQYGWRTAVGLTDQLRRAGVPYCLADKLNPQQYGGYDVMEKYMKTRRCPDVDAGQAIIFSCSGPDSFGYTRAGRMVELWKSC